MANARTAGTRQDTFTIGVQLEHPVGSNPQDLGIWDKRTGGALDSDDVKYYPGAMADQISLGGRRTTDNVVLQRLYDVHDDHEKIQRLFNAVGKGRVYVSQWPLDEDGNAFPNSRMISWVGKLKRVAIPEPDSESTSAALVEIEVSVAGPPALS